ncbi:glycoside hydrolase family 73 protein [Brevibacillus halotolerans]|uniref:glycoside hydrolase family 73 protein n=1 Tax=Brevibacillus TaxID=55080 RepID=UPI00215C4609|nr:MULTISPECIES: glycoside hydrolase family 73 protein [Brevibacillus]MCR8961680.1 glycoside hydrolase family 73 protein [Brevibacillus laterosporus]MCZ0833835.1 glycoside hydrolase family 73 protein [Brevibacillus halotolerans]
MKPQDFIDKIAPSAVADMKKTKIPASLTIAQAILESAWGESGLTKRGNNLFGIKGTGPTGVCAMPTKENYNGQWTTITANFRAYNNWGESIADHSKLILNGTRDKPRRYHGVLGADYKTACHAIHKGGYATDPGYPDKLIGLIEKYDLAKYDKEEITMKPEVANEIIDVYLQAAWHTANEWNDTDRKKRIGQLADELRIASGQEPQNKK